MKFRFSVSLETCLISVTLLFSIFFVSCKKDSELNTENGTTQWMKVLDDIILSGTDDESFQGQNGKVIVDRQDNIYVYYTGRSPARSVVVKCDPEGNFLWRKSFPNSEPMDMVESADGSIILAVRQSAWSPKGIVLYAMRANGSVDSVSALVQRIGSSISVENASIYALQDNSLIISGSYRSQLIVGGSINTNGYFLKIDPSLMIEWKNSLDFISGLSTMSFNTNYDQNSIVPLSNNKYLFEFSISTAKEYDDSLVYGLLTGLLNADGTFDTLYFEKTGHIVQSNGNEKGYINRYCRGLYLENSSQAIFHYSAPNVLSPPEPKVPNGFIRIGSDARILDTIAIPLPVGYRILSCNVSQGRFLISAYRAGIISGTSDYSAYHTLFLTGDLSWRTTNRFSFQQFYSDVFVSSAATSDGGFIIMGKIQSFNETSNKLLLIKWRG